MPLPYLLITLAIVMVWGVNFVFISLGLQDLPPLLLVALRLFLTSIPAVFFIKRPSLPWKTLIIFGLMMYGIQFSFSFMGMHLGVTSGMASVAMQTQVFFSIILATIFLKETCSLGQVIGALIAFSGILVMGYYTRGDVSPIGFLLLLVAAMSWGIGNVMSKQFGDVNALGLLVWSNLFAWPLVLIASYFIEGGPQIHYALTHISTAGWTSLLYITYASTLFGYTGWCFLLKKCPLTVIAPFILLVPVVGMLSSMIILHETLPLWKIVAIILVLSGLVMNLLTSLARMKYKK